MDNYQRSGLDVLFYGQEHFDTLAILSSRPSDIQMSDHKVSDLMKN